MISKDQFFHADESRPHGEKLGYDVDAVAILLDHPDDATELPHDATKPGDGGTPSVRFHRATSGVFMMALARRTRTGPIMISDFLSRDFGPALIQIKVPPGGIGYPFAAPEERLAGPRIGRARACKASMVFL